MKCNALIKKGTAILLAANLFTLFPGTAAYADVSAPTGEGRPEAVFQSLAIGNADTMDFNGYPNSCILSDQIYIEYPGSWSLGTNGYCPLMMYKSTEAARTSSSFEDFFDEKLSGTSAEVKQYVENGGINSYLQQVLGVPITDSYQLNLIEDEDIVLIYYLKQDGVTKASIVIWTFGKLSIRAENVASTEDLTMSSGNIMLFPEWDSTDFSSMEAIQAYVDSGNLEACLEPSLGASTWVTAPFQTENHTYLYCEGTNQLHNLAVYIPVTSGKKWIAVFQSYKASQNSNNAYNLRDTYIKTFRLLK